MLYFTVVYHLTNLYFAKMEGVEAFILRDGGIITTLFWVGQILIGCPAFDIADGSGQTAYLDHGCMH